MKPQTLTAAPDRPGAAPTPDPLPSHFSFSAHAAFQQCPRRWAYTYVLRAEREFAPASLTFGSALHRALECYHWALMGGERPTFDVAWQAYEQTWEEEQAVLPVRFDPDEDRAFHDRMARILLSDYLEEQLPRLDRILAIEETVRCALPGMDVPMIGRLDLLLEEQDALVLVDFKSAQKPFTGEKLRQGAIQLAVYAQAMGEIAEALEKPLRGRFVVLRKLLQPRIEVVEVPISGDHLDSMACVLSETWRLIHAAHAARAFPGFPGWYCRGCQFQMRCHQETGAPGLSR